MKILPPIQLSVPIALAPSAQAPPCVIPCYWPISGVAWTSYQAGVPIFVACQGAKEGGGKFEEEFAAFHIDPRTRMRRMEEAIEILRLASTLRMTGYDQQRQFKRVTEEVLPALL